MARGTAAGVWARTAARRALLAAVAMLVVLAAAWPPVPATDDAAVRTSPAGATAPQRQPQGQPKGQPQRQPDEPVRVIVTGDMLPNDNLLEQARRYTQGRGYSFQPMLSEVRRFISTADWAVCHQETPVSANNETIRSYPLFYAPYQLAAAEAAAGYDACSTASNHSVDDGADGVAATLNTLERYGIRHTGTARTRAEADEATIYRVQGAAIGHLSYTYGLNGLDKPNPWSVNLIDPDRIRADAARLARAGAEIVMVSLHWGNEQVTDPSSYQRRVADEVMRSPHINLIIGHHAHVVQPAQRRDDGRWVLFGLGNFLAQMDATGPRVAHRDGVIAQVTVAPTSPAGDDWRITRVGFIPTFYDASRGRIVLAPPFSRERTAGTLTSMGAPVVDLTPR